jgi:beta-1,4-mannooligosaccharide/beta-1,4-mannosyl-N-acetylglucosamine phosphorylase
MTTSFKTMTKPVIPWESKPVNCKTPVWRFSGNPIITGKNASGIWSICNSAVIPFQNGYAGIFRCDDMRKYCELRVGFSPDGINWEIADERISFISDHNNEQIDEFRWGYDPRVCKIDNKYFISWCNGFNEMPTIGMGYTYDFKSFYQLENAFLPYNRNGVLFPKKINGKYAMLSRPSDNGHTKFGSIFYSESPDMIHWGCHKLVMEPDMPWESTKIGAGPIPIETPHGWLLIYHGVVERCNGFVYNAGVALLDLENPWKVIDRAKDFILGAEMEYECCGEVPNVIFPCAAIHDESEGKIAIYYGAADSVVGLAFAYIDELIDFIKVKND